jgi:hypothetical protein
MPVSIYSDDIEDGKPDNLIADGIAIKYDLSNHMGKILNNSILYTSKSKNIHMGLPIERIQENTSYGDFLPMILL